MAIIKKHSVFIKGHNTSVTLEDAFWKSLKGIARVRKVSVPHLLAAIDAERGPANLSSAVRVFVLVHYREAVRASTNAPIP